MFSLGADFSPTGSGATALTRVGAGLNMASLSNSGTRLTEIDVTDDTGDVSCTQYTVWNPSPSKYLPAASPADCVVPSGFTTSTLLPGLATKAGQKFYLVETFYNNPQLTWVFAPVGSPSGIYMKAVF
jgi:hypothetical protein